MLLKNTERCWKNCIFLINIRRNPIKPFKSQFLNENHLPPIFPIISLPTIQHRHTSQLFSKSMVFQHINFVKVTTLYFITCLVKSGTVKYSVTVTVLIFFCLYSIPLKISKHRGSDASSLF